MLGSSVLDTAIGLALVFAVMATLCSGVTEGLSNVFQMRARYLLQGLRGMLDRTTSSTPNPKALLQAAKNEVTTDGAYAASKQKASLAQPAPPAAPPPAAQSTPAAPPPPQPAQPAAITRPVATVAPVPQLPAGDETPADAPNTLALFGHPLIGGLRTTTMFGRQRLPQYLSSTAFRMALFDTLLPDVVATSPAGTDPSHSLVLALTNSVNGLPDGSLKRTLQSVLTQTGGKLSDIETAVEKWYDDQMARVSGWYKRWSQLILAIAGLIAAALLNIDALQLGHALWVNEPVRAAVVSASTNGTLCQNSTNAADKAKCANVELTTLKATGLPVGYTTKCGILHGNSHWARCWSWSDTSTLHKYDFLWKLVGWLITAAAVSFGAPFWFEALSKLGSLRSTGTKPPTGAESQSAAT